MAAKNKLLHILGGGAWQMPSVQLAKRLGYRVLVTDMYRERPAYALADYHEVVDITDMTATLEVARWYQIDGILCDTTDVGVPTAAYVAEQLGLPGIGYDVALNFTNKHRMRTITHAAGLPNPRFKLATSVADARAAAAEIGFPLIVKPVDSQSSRGVHRVDSAAALEASVADALKNSRSKNALVEQFLPGVEITVEGLCWQGEYHTLGISDKDHFSFRPTVASRLTYPAAFDAVLMEKIRRTNAAVVRALGLKHGITHAEYMVHGNDVTLVEIAARGGGSRVYSHIAPYLAGIDVPRLWMQHCLGENPPLKMPGGQRAANLAFFTFPGGKVAAIDGLEEAKSLAGVNEILLEFSVGDTIEPPSDDRSRPGLMVVFGSTREEVLKISAQVEQTVRVRVA